jgi:sortase A
VGQTEIVQPEDVSVLADNGSASLTLVTCYPFYFVGNAPQRFIVHAAALNIDGIKGPSSTTAGEINLKEKLK